MRKILFGLTLLAVAGGTGASALAQGMPTTQPKFVHIIREQIKPGRTAAHAKWEAGWPAAFEKAKSPHHYLALESITGAPEVLFVIPLANQAAYDAMMAAERDASLAPEMDRLSAGDEQFLAGQSALQAVAMPELSQGAFPDIGKTRYYEISTFRVKPGHEDAWIAATKAYKGAAARSAPGASWRTYAVVAGSPGGTYLVFSSVGAFAEFDKMAAEGEATMKGATPEEMGALGSFMKESVVEVSTNRYRVDPRQSYVDAATREKDAAFWAAKP